MAKVNFDRATVDRLIAHTKAATKHSLLYGDKSTAKPGLWLVGDDGIYLMSNGDPALLVKEGENKNVVAYAKEADPTTMPHDEVWEAKTRIWGGDDGVEFLSLADLEGDFATYPPEQKTYALGITQKGIGVYRYIDAPKKPNGKSPKKAA